MTGAVMPRPITALYSSLSLFYMATTGTIVTPREHMQNVPSLQRHIPFASPFFFSFKSIR